MTAEVLQLDERRRKRREAKERETPCPEHLSPEQLAELLDWGMRNGYALEELIYGWENTQDWAKGGGVTKVDWVATVRVHIKKGWARAGYANWLSRRKRPPRTLTPELIERLVETRREECGAGANRDDT